MKTITILINNTDDELNQKAWVQFVNSINDSLIENEATVRFFGNSEGADPLQKACWVIEEPVRKTIQSLEQRVFSLANFYGQNDFFWIENAAQNI